MIDEQLQFQRQQVNAARGDSSDEHAPRADDVDAAALGVKPPNSNKVSLPLLLAMTMVMALLSGVGAAPYLFTGKLNPYWSGIANAVGCGVMLAASFDLLEEAKPFSPKLVMGGIALGIIAMKLSQEYLEQYEDVSFSDLQVRGPCMRAHACARAACMTCIHAGAAAAHPARHVPSATRSVAGEGWARPAAARAGSHPVPQAASADQASTRRWPFTSCEHATYICCTANIESLRAMAPRACSGAISHAPCIRLLHARVHVPPHRCDWCSIAALITHSAAPAPA